MESETAGGGSSGIKPADHTKLINESPHTYGSSSAHREMGGENPKEGRITGSK